MITKTIESDTLKMQILRLISIVRHRSDSVFGRNHRLIPPAASSRVGDVAVLLMRLGFLRRAADPDFGDFASCLARCI